MARDLSSPGISTVLRALSSGPPTGVVRRLEALTEQIEEVAARRSSSSPPEPCPDSDAEPRAEPSGPATSTGPDRH